MKPRRARKSRPNPPVAPNPERSVFINCPFDDDYLPLFDAIVFATTASGYTPRCALESGSVSDPRMDQIFDALTSSKYSIHDLSRCKGEGTVNLARFNMPLEFGIAFGKAYVRYEGRRLHDWLVLLPQGHFYRAVVSDLGAYDPPTHKGTAESIVVPVMAWLATRPNAPETPGPKRVLAAMPQFEAEVKTQRADWGAYLPWKHLLQTAQNVAQSEGLVTAGGDS
jgi:hypothetical protein